MLELPSWLECGLDAWQVIFSAACNVQLSVKTFRTHWRPDRLRMLH